MIMFIDDHREHLGVEAICKVLPIAPSTYYHHKSIELALPSYFDLAECRLTQAPQAVISQA